MVSPSFVIVGTGRCGTGYTATVLTRAGVACGHEAWWNPFGEQAPGLLGDSSWCALALSLDDYGGHVWHQHRHPLAVVTSMAHQPTHEPYRSLQLELMEDDPPDPVDWAALATVTYLERAAERASVHWSLADFSVRLVRWVGAQAGVQVPRAMALAACRSVPRNWNAHHDQPRLGFGDIPNPSLRRRVAAAARRLGYE